MKEGGGGVNQSKKTQNWHRARISRQGIKAVTTIVSHAHTYKSRDMEDKIQCCPTEFPVMMKMFTIYTVQYDSH